MYAAPAYAEERPGLLLTVRALLVAAGLALSVLAAFRPETALVGLLVLVIVVICALRADIALLALVAVIPLEAQYETVPLIGLTPTKAAGALCFISFAFYALRSGLHLVFDMSHALVLLLLALALVSTLQALEVSTALTTTMRYTSFVALYFVVSQFVGDHRLQRRIAWTLSVSSAVAALIALEYFFFEPGYVYRANLKFGDPNQLAFMLATTLPLTFWLLRERWSLRPLVLGMIVVISLAVVFTYSRSALLAIGAGIVFLMMTDRKRVPLLVAAAFVTVAIGLVFVRSSPSTVFRVEEGLRAKEKVAATNVETRLTAWDAAITLAIDHPLLGIGPGNFFFHYGEVTGTPPGAEPLGVVHNAYLDIASELGLAGLGLFLAFLVLAYARLTGAKRQSMGPPGYAAALRVSLVIACVGAITLSEQYSAPFWLIGGLATALWLEGRLLSGHLGAFELRRPVGGGHSG
jgi:putative inorganic carbon (hco3(-)) transporter